jgi:Tfp pilus assembly protein PilZ
MIRCVSKPKDTAIALERSLASLDGGRASELVKGVRELVKKLKSAERPVPAADPSLVALDDLLEELGAVRQSLKQARGSLAVKTEKAGTMMLVDATLKGQTNFYVTLAGNDVLKHGGLFIQTTLRLALSSQLRVRVTFPDGDAHEAAAIVTFHRDGDPGGMGVSFFQMEDAFRKKVYAYVKERAPLRHTDV